MKTILFVIAFIFTLPGHVQGKRGFLIDEGDVVSSYTTYYANPSVQENYMSLASVPIDVRRLMTEEERAVWAKMASRFLIDYEFVKHKSYQANKKVVLRYVQNVYDYVLSQGLPTQRLYVSCLSDSCVAVFCDALLAERQLKHYKSSYKVSENIALEVFAVLLPLRDKHGNVVAYKPISSTTVCNPSNATFYGATAVIETDKKGAEFSAIAYVYSDGKRYDVKINID